VSCRAATRERCRWRSPRRWRASCAPQVLCAPSRPRHARNPPPTRFQRDVAPLESVGRMAAPARGHGRDGHAQPGHDRAGPDQRDELLDPAGAGECGSERSVRPRACRHARPTIGQADEADEVDAGRTSTSCARAPKKVDHFAAAEWITVSPPPKPQWMIHARSVSENCYATTLASGARNLRWPKSGMLSSRSFGSCSGRQRLSALFARGRQSRTRVNRGLRPCVRRCDGLWTGGGRSGPLPRTSTAFPSASRSR
jgi:hypothetical protein